MAFSEAALWAIIKILTFPIAKYFHLASSTVINTSFTENSTILTSSVAENSTIPTSEKTTIATEATTTTSLGTTVSSKL